MAIQFPESLPCFSATYSYAQKNTITSTEFTSGFKRNRRRFKDVPVNFELSLEHITDEQLAIFEAWRYYEVEDVNWFNATLKTGDGLQDWSVRFNGTGETKSYSEGFWTLSFTVEAKKNRLSSKQVYVLNDRAGLDTLGRSETVSKTVVLDAIIGTADSDNYPALDRFPSASLLPASASFDEYVYTLSYAYDLTSGLTLSDSVSVGATSISVNSIDDITIINDNPWDYSQGVRPEYESSYSSAISSIEQTASKPIIQENGLILIGGSTFARVSQEFNLGDSIIYLQEALTTSFSEGAVVI